MATTEEPRVGYFWDDYDWDESVLHDMKSMQELDDLLNDRQGEPSMSGKKKQSKAERVLEFMQHNPHMGQAEVRAHFMGLGVKVSCAETSIAAKKIREEYPKGSGQILSVPVAESPVMARNIRTLRQKNEKLRMIIDLLLDEEAWQWNETKRETN